VERSIRLSSLPSYPFAQLDRAAAEARARGVDLIDLSIGDPDLPTPDRIVKRLSVAARDPANHRYPAYRGSAAFRRAVAAYYGRRFRVHVDPEREVLALIGSKEGNLHTALAFIDPGDVGLMPDPGYPAYGAAIVFAGGEPFAMRLERARGYVPYFRDVPGEVARRAKVMYLNYPNMPTAATVDLAFMREAVAFAREYDIVLCHDNPYADIWFDGPAPPSPLQVEGAREHVIELNSLSKPFNMTGWRVGMAVGGADIVDAVASVKENVDSGVFGAVQDAAVEALSGLARDEAARLTAVYRRRRDALISALRRLGAPVELPKATMYVWCPVPTGETADSFARRLLERAGILVAPGTAYGAGGEGHVRFSLTVDDDRLHLAIERIERSGVKVWR